MCKRIMILFFISIISISSFSQVLTGAAKINEAHDKMSDLVSKSYTVVLSDSIINILRTFAQANHYDLPNVMKNTALLKPVLNENLSIAERIFACEFVINSFSNNSSSMMLPTKLFMDQYTLLNKLKSQKQ